MYQGMQKRSFLLKKSRRRICHKEIDKPEVNGIKLRKSHIILCVMRDFLNLMPLPHTGEGFFRPSVRLLPTHDTPCKRQTDL